MDQLAPATIYNRPKDHWLDGQKMPVADCEHDWEDLMGTIKQLSNGDWVADKTLMRCKKCGGYEVEKSA